MYAIYESSPRRSPRRVRPIQDPTSNILKPKSSSPIRKTKALQSSTTKPLSSVNAPLKSTGNGKPKTVVRKTKVNNEDKENCAVAPRRVRIGASTGLGVNGSSVSSKNTQPLVLKKAIPGRLPLKELPLNGFLDRLKKCDVAPSVEIVSTVVSNEGEAGTTANSTEGTRNMQNLDDGVGIGSDWETNGVIR